jgi:hypothetical protein
VQSLYCAALLLLNIAGERPGVTSEPKIRAAQCASGRNKAIAPDALHGATIDLDGGEVRAL